MKIAFISFIASLFVQTNIPVEDFVNHSQIPDASSAVSMPLVNILVTAVTTILTLAIAKHYEYLKAKLKATK